MLSWFNSSNTSLIYGQIKIDETSGIWTSGWVDVLDEKQGMTRCFIAKTSKQFKC